MKKRTGLFAIITAVVLLLAGCGTGSSVSNDYIEISQYKGVEIARVVPVEVTDQDVEDQMDYLVSIHEVHNPVTDRGAEAADYAVVDFTGLIDGVAYEGFTYNDYTLFLGTDSFIEGFDAQIEGHYEGEQLEFDLALPDPYYFDESISGATVHWIVTIDELYTTETPKLTDDFVKNELAFPGIETVEQFRKYVRTQLEEQAESDAQYAREEEVWEAVYNNTELKAYPEGVVESYVEETRATYDQYAAEAAMTFADYIGQMDMTVDEFMDQITQAAQNTVIQDLVFRSIADAENLNVDDSTYEARKEEFATELGFSDAKELESLYDRDEIKDAMMQDQVLAFLVDNARETGTGGKFVGSTLFYVLCAVCTALILAAIILGLIKHKKSNKNKKASDKDSDNNGPKLDENGYVIGLEIPDPEEERKPKIGDTQVIVTSDDYQVNSYDPAVEPDPTRQ